MHRQSDLRAMHIYPSYIHSVQFVAADIQQRQLRPNTVVALPCGSVGAVYVLYRPAEIVCCNAEEPMAHGKQIDWDAGNTCCQWHACIKEELVVAATSKKCKRTPETPSMSKNY